MKTLTKPLVILIVFAVLATGASLVKPRTASAWIVVPPPIACPVGECGPLGNP